MNKSVWNLGANKTMKMIVDADACPVKDIIIDLSADYQVPVVLVSSINHYSLADYPDWVKTIYVEHGPDSADFKIVQIAKAGDIVVTQDYGLASLVLNKGVRTLHHKGFEYTSTNISQLLQTRYLSAQARKGGQRTKGPAPLKDKDRAAFRALLEEVLSESN